MNGEDEEWEIANNREQEVEKDVKKWLNKEKAAVRRWKMLNTDIIREDDTPFPHLITHIDRFDSSNRERMLIRSRIKLISLTFPRDLSQPVWQFRICLVYRSFPCQGIDSIHHNRIDRNIYFELFSWRICPNNNPETISNWSLIYAIRATNTTRSRNYFHSVDQLTKLLRIPAFERSPFPVWKWPKVPKTSQSKWCWSIDQSFTFNL